MNNLMALAIDVVTCKHETEISTSSVSYWFLKIQFVLQIKIYSPSLENVRMNITWTTNDF